MRAYSILRFLIGRKGGLLVAEAFFLVLLYPIYSNLVKGWQSTDFVKTNGVTLASSLKRSYGGGLFILPLYVVDISYRYKVEGKYYIGHRIGYNLLASHANANRLLAKFPIGCHPIVYYNPNNPKDSLLLPGIQGQSIVICVCLLPILLALLWHIPNIVKSSHGKSGNVNRSAVHTP